MSFIAGMMVSMRKLITDMTKIGFVGLALIIAALPAKADVLIGLAAPLTGQYAVFGEQMRRGAEEAVLDLNAKGGILGEKITLHTYDDACDPRQAVSVANQMVGAGIKFVVGHFCSGSTIPASKIYNDENILMITPASTNPLITEQGFGSVFRISGRSSQLGPVLAHYMIKHFSDRKIAIIQDQTSYGQSLADETKKALNAGGIKEILYDSYSPGQRDYSALVSRLKQIGTQVLFIGGYHTEIGLITRQLKEQGADIQIVTGNALTTSEFWSIAGKAGEGTLMAYGPDPRENAGAAAPVKALRKSGFEPEGNTLYTYAAFEVIAEGIKRAGDADPTKVSSVLKQSPINTVFGPISFDAMGDMTGFYFQMYRWHNGKYQKIED